MLTYNYYRKYRMPNFWDKVAAFVGGDALATTLTIYLSDIVSDPYSVRSDIQHEVVKLIFIVIAGFFGGIVGLLGKDIYNSWIYPKLKRHLKFKDKSKSK